MHLIPLVKEKIALKLRRELMNAGDLNFEAVSGGSINQTFRIAFQSGNYFCKINDAASLPGLLKTEKSGLELLAKTTCIKVPEVYHCFEAGGKQILLMEWISSGEKTDSFWKRFGTQLAALHHCTATTYGLREANYMGAVPQQNTPAVLWETFFTEQRLRPMVARCANRHLLSYSQQSLFQNVFKNLGCIFPEEKPSLLHGDLWSGNFLCNSSQQPVLIDPAVYYGHRCMDLAMTTLFGGFAPAFYEAYNYNYPLPGNYKEQWQVCNLYPLLIHLYLFGGSYLPQIQSTLQKFI